MNMSVLLGMCTLYYFVLASLKLMVEKMLKIGHFYILLPQVLIFWGKLVVSFKEGWLSWYFLIRGKLSSDLTLTPELDFI